MAEPRIITLGCRLNAYESEVMRAHAAAAGLDDTRSSSTRAPSPRKPCARRRRPSAGCAARTRRRASSSRAAPRRSSRERFAALSEVDHVVGNAEKMQRGDVRRTFDRRLRARAGRRHHERARDRRASHRRLRLAHARLRADPERLRSPLHVLHHSVRARTVALGAGRRGRGAGSPRSSSAAAARSC